MNARPLVAASVVTLAALAAAGCNRPATSGYNNTGNSASTEPDRKRPSTEVAKAPEGGSSVKSESLGQAPAKDSEPRSK